MLRAAGLLSPARDQEIDMKAQIGRGISETRDPDDDSYWRETYRERTYYRDLYKYDDYEPAYRLGYNAAARNLVEGQVRPYDNAVDEQLRGFFDHFKGGSSLTWPDARLAVQDAYERRAERMRVGVAAGTSGMDQ
jgi:hypothetical protein